MSPLPKEEPNVGRREDLHLSSPSKQHTFSNLHNNSEEDILQMMKQRISNIK